MEAILKTTSEHGIIDVILENSDVLLPCPFCGSESELAHTHTPSYWIECKGCGAQVGDLESWKDDTNETHIESAKRLIKAWNQRA